MASLKESLAGPGFVILNAIRVLNIIALLDIIAACAVMLVKISLLSSFFFFEAASHVIIAGVSKLPFFRGYFDHNWPLLGQDSGFITLALAMLILGVSILGDLNTEATSQESLGNSFWQIVLSAGILAMIMSAINLVAYRVNPKETVGHASIPAEDKGTSEPGRRSVVKIFKRFIRSCYAQLSPSSGDAVWTCLISLTQMTINLSLSE
ncbi:hypothetical protein APSETT444_000698 [Aspergillus pseudonomiae]